MPEKSHVSLEQNQCFVCGEIFSTGSLLLDRRLRASMEHHTCTGFGICPSHQAELDAGRIFLIEAESQDSRSGNFCSLPKEVFLSVFNTPLPPKGVAFIDIEAFQKLLSHAYALEAENEN